MDIRFYREESSKELGIKADCNYLVVAKDIGDAFKLMPYSIWYCEDSRCYVAVRVRKSKSGVHVNDTLGSHEKNEEEVEAFNTLKDAKEWIYYDIKGAN